MLDNIKNQGYQYSTRSGITVAVCDRMGISMARPEVLAIRPRIPASWRIWSMEPRAPEVIPPEKKELITAAEKEIDSIHRQYDRGFITEEDRP